MLSPQTRRGSALLKSTPVFILGLFLPLKKSKESELTELIKLILLKHDRVFFCFVLFLKWSLAIVWTCLLPAVTRGKKEGTILGGYRNSDHTWMCTCISWQEGEVALEMLLSWCDGMLRAPCLLLHTKAKKSTLPQLESISLQVPNTQSIRGQFLTCLTFLPCTEGFLAFVYCFSHQTANFIRSKSRSDNLGIVPCSGYFLGW